MFKGKSKRKINYIHQMNFKIKMPRGIKILQKQKAEHSFARKKEKKSSEADILQSLNESLLQPSDINTKENFQPSDDSQYADLVNYPTICPANSCRGYLCRLRIAPTK